uniref:Uncharacterized protein n=1 Tax=Rhizophora mucronata TaxID=61149 RepID=A0A2P2PT65_RHIMU
MFLIQWEEWSTTGEQMQLYSSQRDGLKMASSKIHLHSSLPHFK